MVMDALGSLLGQGGSAPPSVRRPVYEISLGGSSTAWDNSVTAVRASAGLFPSLNAVEIDFDPAVMATPALKDAGEVKLGYEDEGTTRVMQGQVQSMRRSLRRDSSLTLVDGGALLAQRRLQRSYEQQTAGDIVRDLAGAAEVDTDTIEDGVDLPFYVVDTGRSLHQHIATLARLSGYVALVAPDGKLHFKPYVAGQPVQSFSCAIDVIGLRAAESTPLVGSVTVQGEGAAGSQGSDTWHWLIKDPGAATGSAGDGSPRRALVRPGLRSPGAATAAAAGSLEAAGRLTSAGELTVPGAPRAFPGSTIEISDAPDEALNGQCLVRWVKHMYAKHTGFISVIAFSKVGGVGGAAGLLDTIGGIL